MSNKLTKRFQRVILLAQEEAKRLNYDYVATEHILLGLIALGEGGANQVITNLNVSPQSIRADVEKAIGVGDNVVLLSEIPFTPMARLVLTLARNEAHDMGVYVGTEHLLLGLCDEPDGVARQVLNGLGLTADRVRQEIRKIESGDVDLTENPLNFPPNSSVEVGGTKEVSKAQLDTVWTKTVYIDGKRVGNCHRVIIDMDIAKSLTEVTMSFVVVKDSLTIDANKISFDLQWPEKEAK